MRPVEWSGSKGRKLGGAAMGSVDSERPERFYGVFLHGNLVGGRKSTNMKTKVISFHDAM